MEEKDQKKQTAKTSETALAEAQAIIEAAEAEAQRIVEEAMQKAAELAEADPKPTPGEINMERQLALQEKTLKQQLDEMPKVAIEIPEDPLNPDDVVPVTWNGITYAIPRGRQFEVPKAIYDIWKESHVKTQEINKRIRDSVEKEVKILD